MNPINTRNVEAKKFSLNDLYKMVQEMHERVGAPSTQNVRNAEPVHVTVVRCLPSKQRDSITFEELLKRVRNEGAIASTITIRAIVNQLKQSNKINSIRYSNVPFLHYYFGLH
jgi:hypothetical protein